MIFRGLSNQNSTWDALASPGSCFILHLERRVPFGIWGGGLCFAPSFPAIFMADAHGARDSRGVCGGHSLPAGWPSLLSFHGFETVGKFTCSLISPWLGDTLNQFDRVTVQATVRDIAPCLSFLFCNWEDSSGMLRQGDAKCVGSTL